MKINREKLNSIKDEMEVVNSLIEKIVNKGNPYHDKIGRFTWSPFGKYKGDPYKAESIYGKEYRDMIKNYADTFTDEEREVIRSYINSPQLGNSYEKNGSYKQITMFFDKEGNPLTPQQLKEATELYEASEKFGIKWDEQQALKKELNDKYLVLNNQMTPAPVWNMVKEDIVNKPDFVKTVSEIEADARAVLGEKYGNLSYEHLREIVYDGWHRKELFPELPKFSEMSKDMQGAFEALVDIEGKRDKYKKDDEGLARIRERNPDYKGYTDEYYAERAEFENGTATMQNTVKYSRFDDSLYMTTKYPNSGKEEKGVTAQFVASLTDAQLEKYRDVYAKMGKFSPVASAMASELEGRKMDRIIQEKGITLDKDFMVTRRVSTIEAMKQEVNRSGYFIQSGFTSTTAANNIAKKSPGNMVFGDNVLKIVIPAGTKFLPVEAIAKHFADKGDTGMSRGILNQHEIVLPTGTKYISLDQSKRKTLTNMEDTKAKFSPSLQLDKIDTSYDFKRSEYKNTLTGFIAITDQYQKGH